MSEGESWFINSRFFIGIDGGIGTAFTNAITVLLEAGAEGPGWREFNAKLLMYGAHGA